MFSVRRSSNLPVAVYMDVAYTPFERLRYSLSATYTTHYAYRIRVSVEKRISTYSKRIVAATVENDYQDLTELNFLRERNIAMACKNEKTKKPNW